MRVFIISGITLFFFMLTVAFLRFEDRPDGTSRVTLERMVFSVQPGMVDQFLDTDQRVWTTYLEQKEGFLRKEVFLNYDDSSSVTVLIYWNTPESWFNIPRKEMMQIDSVFNSQFNAEFYTLEVVEPLRIYNPSSR
ncbi:MAG: TIGR03792 family protein [Bacteroidota bacterium]